MDSDSKSVQFVKETRVTEVRRPKTDKINKGDVRKYPGGSILQIGIGSKFRFKLKFMLVFNQDVWYSKEANPSGEGDIYRFERELPVAERMYGRASQLTVPRAEILSIRKNTLPTEFGPSDEITFIEKLSI
jgi:hypothetical protein